MRAVAIDGGNALVASRQAGAVMGTNKQIHKRIQGHRSMILEHEAKIRKELESSNPREYLIAYWQRRVDEVKLRILRLEEKLSGR